MLIVMSKRLQRTVTGATIERVIGISTEERVVATNAVDIVSLFDVHVVLSLPELPVMTAM